MKTDFVPGIMLFFISLFIYTKFIGPIPFSVSSVTTNKSAPFTVTGEGKAAAAPDIAVLNAGVVVGGATVKEAQDNLNTAINKVAQTVKNAGIDSKDIQTSNYSVNPNYDYRVALQHINGYSANSNLIIKIRNIDKVNSVIDAAAGAGANQVGGVAFDISDKTNAQNEARRLAVADAKAKAENAARLAGFKLGRIINYNEDFGGQPRPISMMAKAETGGGAMPPTQVEPGTNEINVTVTLSYEIL